jgi:hypothetical protein
MRTRAGLWIDHEEAVIVFLSDESEEAHFVACEPHAARSGARDEGQDAPAGRAGDAERRVRSSRDRGRYYDEVVARLGDAQSILVFGLAESTREVEARLDRQERSDRVIGVGTAERMTASEIASEVRQRFRV